MQAAIKKMTDGSVALKLDADAARAVFASVLFAARFHEGKMCIRDRVSAAYYAGDRWIAEKRLNYNNPDVVAYVEAVRLRYTMRKRAATGMQRR